MNGAAGDFQVDLNIDVGCPRMPPVRVRAEECRHQTAEEYKLRSAAVMMHDANKRQLSCPARRFRAEFLIGHVVIASRTCSAASSPRTPVVRRSAYTRGQSTV